MILVGLGVVPLAKAQQPPAGSSPPQHTTADPLDNVLLQNEDGQEIPQDLFNRVTFHYQHVLDAGEVETDLIRVDGEQIIGPIDRFAFSYEIPFFVDTRVSGEPSVRGMGDIKLVLNARLTSRERFDAGAGAEFTLPSGSNGLSGGQNIVKMVFGISTPLASRTVLNAILGYEKGMTAPKDVQGANNIRPQLILSQGFTRRFGAFLDWESYYDFKADQFGQTLKLGLEFDFDQAGRWSLSPYTQFPLNHFTSSTNLKNESGFDFTYRY